MNNDQKVSVNFDSYKKEKADDREKLIERMVVCLKEKFKLDLNGQRYSREIISMTYDWGLTEGIQFAIENEEE